MNDLLAINTRKQSENIIITTASRGPLKKLARLVDALLIDKQLGEIIGGVPVT
ncbi:hypothetical protein ACH61_00819 [Rathayibacter tanaceti]|uniref:Uncharacterized protein n=1 Tax=Rathayibacter tanaceti TaxID=1671680 RepID=A0A166IAC6_9MICO|nr:hypothetical protein ACH61_00819 [Rathayibacter tanaceti]